MLSYDGRWDKLYGAQATRPAAAWDFAKSPIVFHARERVARVAVPGLEGRRLTSHPRTLFSPRSAAGSFVSFERLPPVPTGADATFDGLRFEGEARFEAGRLALAKDGDGLAFRVREGARPRRLEIRVVGRGQGRIGVAESGGGSGTRWRDETVSGSFRHPTALLLRRLGRAGRARRAALGRAGRDRVGVARAAERAGQRAPAALVRTIHEAVLQSS